MKKLLLLTLILNTFLLSNNLFIIKNKDGTIAKNKKLRHIENSFFNDLIEEQEQLLSKIKSKKNRIYNKDQILNNAKKYLGGKYVWGGTQPKGFDCSGYVQYLYKKEGVALPRTAYAQSKVGMDVSRSKLKKGDLLFFLTDKKRNIPITHVGMYIGNDQFIHAASKKKGIIISSLSKSKYSKIYVKAKRIIK
ncbi:NLP/P60 family protein [hydrothermal vent metagenome]|uniref:NLP/P60 family protein n=1 Tax=hydrothermal vent metagenome TaxID=652676 RepID=A0A1W1CFL4_9ZZZZ